MWPGPQTWREFDADLFRYDEGLTRSCDLIAMDWRQINQAIDSIRPEAHDPVVTVFMRADVARMSE
jgi:hypothetical protein